MKYTSKYFALNKEILEEALNPERLGFLSEGEEDEYEEPSEDIFNNVSLDLLGSKGLGVIWRGADPLTPNTLIAWYTGRIARHDHHSHPFPQDTT